MKRYRGPIILGVIGIVLAAIGGGLLVSQVVSLANTASLTEFSTPGQETINLDPAEYAVYERVSTTSGGSSFDSGTSSLATVTTDQISVTGPNGAVPVRCANCSGGYEELTLGGATYTAVAHFDVTDAGNYTVSVNGDGARVAVALSVSGVTGNVLGSLVPFAIGGFLMFVAIIWAIILAVTGGRKEPVTAAGAGAAGYPGEAQPVAAEAAAQQATAVPPTAPPPAGWYPNPDNPAEQRWWTGTGWSDIVEKGP
ncbi:DUF2510 domain-containing protein [Candidatus Nanopelagicales bacterium]|nr:DUF2510 domain-containing protein [Candidatus Nanopelagicales bacterium]